MLTDLKVQNIQHRLSESLGGRGSGALLFEKRTSGVIEAYYRYTHNSKDQLVKIGKFRKTRSSSGYTLAECRQKAAEFVAMRRECGGDLKRFLLEREQEYRRIDATKKAEEAIEAKRGTLIDLFDAYIELMKSKGKSSTKEVQRMLERDVSDPFPNLAATKARDITPDDIVAILARIHNRGSKVHANRVRSYLHAAFNYGLKADYDYTRAGEKRFGVLMNPVTSVPKQGQYEKARDRYLSHSEVRRLWYTLPQVEKVGLLIVAVIRFILATAGQRPKQLLRATWKDYDLEKRTVTLFDPKGKGGIRKHVVPLTPRAIKIIKEVHPITFEYKWPFSTHGNTPIYVDSLSTAIHRFHKHLCKEADGNGNEYPQPFTPRDLRQTCKNLLIDAGVNRESRNVLQSHAQTGVDIDHYDRSDHMEEKKKAIARYDRLLNRILK